MKNLFKNIKEWWIFWTAPLPDPICPDCGQAIHSFGPDSPRHECSIKDQVKMALKEIEEEKRNET